PYRRQRLMCIRYSPYTGERVPTAITANEKERQRQFFFWYDSTRRASIIATLRSIGRPDLIARLFGDRPPHRRR
ncbi:MAG: hypothetical protein K2L28_07195, partial [Muribaculaceae bacterium]|nr:hypothetical protein [Muribaculaceae bacterium]